LPEKKVLTGARGKRRSSTGQGEKKRKREKGSKRGKLLSPEKKKTAKEGENVRKPQKKNRIMGAEYEVRETREMTMES